MKRDWNILKERYTLAMERIGLIASEETAAEPFRSFFVQMSGYLTGLGLIRERVEASDAHPLTQEEWKRDNEAMYAPILPDNYRTSWANPAYACSMLGSSYGKLLCLLSAELFELPGLVFQSVPLGTVSAGTAAAFEELTIHLELFLQIYNAFERKEEDDPEFPSADAVRKILYWFFSDYCDVIAADRVFDSLDPRRNFAVRIVRESDLADPCYLYRYGEYVTESELDTARYLNSLSAEEIDAIARTFTGGYRTGFVKAGKDLSAKRTVVIEYHLGFERIVRRAMERFSDMGLETVIYRRALSRITKNGTGRRGYTGAIANPQFDFDHKEDQALFLDNSYIHRKLSVLRNAYEACRDMAAVHAGPAVMETFGEAPFAPADNRHAWKLGKRQQDQAVRLRNETIQLTNEYIDPNQRSFTIIAFPVPEIGESFGEIFRETVKVNTLDSRVYEEIQQRLIDVLDRAEGVRVKGCGGNRTDLYVAFMPKTDPSRQTVFENCTADVNIPVGEVFTSPKLEGTGGILHVKQVYLNGLDYRDLSLTFTDGMISDYGCGGFPTREAGRDYIRDTVLFQHASLPMGEFAIGTNTTAYAMMTRYGIGARMPILIAEKCGPHFAVGDTCYSWEEDIPVFNPDGKEVIARDNSVSLLRKEGPSRAYFGCHTDITIPYDQLGLLEAVLPDGSTVPILEDGRFVLPGTEQLNGPLDAP